MISKQQRKALKITNQWLENPNGEQQTKPSAQKYRKPKETKSKQKTFLIDASGNDNY